MAIRNDLTIDWAASPRIITVAAPSVELTMQDLYDTLRNLAAQPAAMDEAEITDGSGKEPLGGGVLVGLTIKLLNAQAAFEARLGPSWVECNLTGGNLVAVDADGNAMSSVKPTAYVFIVKTASASATLQELSAIQYSSFGGGVTIDAINGQTGTAYPIGTAESPVNNLINAQTIAIERGFNKIYVKGNLTIGATDNISNYTLVGQGAGTFNSPKTTITLTSGCVTSNTVFEHAKVQGRQNGECVFFDCIIGELTNTHCRFKDCAMVGPVQMVNSEWTQNHTTDLINCHSSYEWYVVDYNDSPINQVYSNYSGKIKIINCTDSRADIMIRLDAGMVWIDASCTAGTISVKGVGTLINDSGLDVDTVGFLEGNKLTDLHDEAFGKWVVDPTGNTLTLYRADGVTVLKLFNLTEAAGAVPAYVQRVPA